MTALRTAILGCGAIGRLHADALDVHPGFEIVAVVDPLPPASEALAERISARGGRRPGAHSTLTEALDAARPDLVAVCTPSGLHIAAATEALERGAHVVVEKPLDIDLERARAFAETARLARQRGMLTSVVSQHRFDPASVAVASAVAEGRLGRLTSAVASVPWWRSQEYYDSAAWRGTWEFDGGGALMNQGVHTLDLLLWWLGRPVEVTAMSAISAHERIEVEDVLAAVIRFESGALATVHATTAAYPGSGTRLHLHGDRGSVAIESDELVALDTDRPDLDAAARAAIDAPERVPVPIDIAPDDGVRAALQGHVRQYDDVHRAIREGRAPGVTVDDGLLVLSTVHAVYESARLGRPVMLDAVLR